MLLVATLATSCGGRAATTASDEGGAGASAGEGSMDWAACKPGDQCVLETQTACGPGCEPVELGRLIAINAKNDEAFRKQRPIPPCIDIQCPMVPPSSVNTPNYYAACEADRCTAFDLRRSALSACTSDAQCALRSGTECCACGSDDLVAVSTESDPRSIWCGATEICARDCTEPPPPLRGARCSDGHCAVDY